MTIQVTHNGNVPLDADGQKLVELTQAVLSAVDGEDHKKDLVLSAVAIALCTIARALDVPESALISGIKQANTMVMAGKKIQPN